jgi:hypothetical protein
VKLSKIFKVFKKGAGAASKFQGSAPPGGFTWPSGTRIGIYGHSNAGKTVFFTVLNEESKVARNLQLSVTDNATAGEFLMHYRMIWGLGSAVGAGTAVDLRGEKKFPELTTGERLLLFNAIIDRKKKVPVVTYDYTGRAVSISDSDELQGKVIDFMAGCNGILFFYDPKLLGNELGSQAHVASFVNMLERLAPLKSRVPIPIALVITKADILEGFTGESQSVLISPEDEQFLSEDFETFLDRVLSSNKVASNPAWAGTVRNVLVRMKDFLRVVVGRTLDFQIFFVSNTGQTPERIGTDVGRSLYTPPPKIHPVGVKEPFYWLLKSILRSRRVSRYRRLAQIIAVACFIWIIAYSIPFLIHFWFLLPSATGFETRTLAAYGNNQYNLPGDKSRQIVSAYRAYDRNFIVKGMFSQFLPASMAIQEKYSHVGGEAIGKELEDLTTRFYGIVADTSSWPKPKIGENAFTDDDRTAAYQLIGKQLKTLKEAASIDATMDAAIGRIIWLHDKFAEALLNPDSLSVWDQIREKVQRDNAELGDKMGRSEKILGQALSRKQSKQVAKVEAQKVSSDFGTYASQINSNMDVKYRLETAVEELRRLRVNLATDPSGNAKQIAMIDNYIQKAEAFKQDKTYTFRITACPPGYHLHIKVVGPGKKDEWPKRQYRPGGNSSLTWRVGDTIVMVLHKDHPPDDPSDESWGARGNQIPLKDKYSIFQMEAPITFGPNQVVSFEFTPKLLDILPKLE